MKGPARFHLNSGFEPELQPMDVDLSGYDVIAVGTPTCLKGNDFSGKTVALFMTNGGWPGHVIKDMTAACPGADVQCPARIRFDSQGGDRLETPQAEIDAWIQSVKGLLA